LWVGIDNGLAVYEGGRFQAVTRPDGSPIGVVTAIAEDIDNNVWVEVALGHAPLIRIKDLRFREEIVSPRLFALAADPKGGIWLGSVNEGLLRYREGRFESIPPKVPEIRSLLVDPDGSLWAATRGGLVRWQDGKLKSLNSANGLPCDSIAAVTRDNSDSLWLFAKCGVITITKAELETWWKHPANTVKLQVFDIFDGAQPTLMSYRPGVSRSPDGRLWFVNDSILQVIDPGHLESNPVPPAVHVEKVTADQKVYWNNSLGNKSPVLRLPRLVRDVEINYTALSLMAPDKVRFRYKLEGRDSDWRSAAGDHRSATYNDLPPRDYRFRVIACNNSGVWNEEGASIDFSIAPAYYQTLWFKASWVAALMAVVWALYRLRLHQVALEFNVRMEERVGERTRMARDLHDTLLQSFHGLMLHLQAVSKLLPEGKALEQLEKTMERADNAIAEGRNAVYDLRSSITATNDLAEAVNAIGSQHSGDNDVAFNLMVEGTTRDLHPIIRDEIYRISREALSNAFKHAHARNIEAEISYGPRAFRVRIRDDGEGIPAEILEQGRAGHFGLAGIRERAKQIGAELIIWSRPGSGTEIDLSLAGKIAYGTAPRRPRFGLFRQKER
jgi:signal transduction histidine kinase